jgi:hypothetical protein
LIILIIIPLNSLSEIPSTSLSLKSIIVKLLTSRGVTLPCFLHISALGFEHLRPS